MIPQAASKKNNLPIFGVAWAECRAVGKDAPPTGRQVQQQNAPTRPSVRSFLGLGDGESETSRLMQGQDSSSQGDLDSIFAKMDGSQQQVM